MKLKHTITNLFGGLFVFSTLIAVNTSAQHTLSEEEKQFDLNGDRRLSEDEKEIMIEAITLETFTGMQLTEQEIREMRRDGGPRRFGRRGGFGGGRGPRRAEKIVSRFDTDKDGKLNDEERKAARKYIHESRGVTGVLRPSEPTSPDTTRQDDLKTSQATRPDGAPDLYEAKTLRTLYLRFHDADWYEQLGDFYRTDVDVPADLIVDGKLYPSIGVRFRGSSSYFTVQNEKKSFNITVDYRDDKQRLYGYKTLNLLNGHSDASFLREVLYSRIARNYIPAPKANFVKLVINGENWGIYINSQQFNKDFLDEWFGTKKGVRWKVPPGRNSGLVYNGDDPADYQQSYQLKTKVALNPDAVGAAEAPTAWDDLVKLCEIFDKTSDDQLESELSAVFNIDRALWFLALENVFIDNDGYISRASDYALYQDPTGRFHLLSQDSNETFRFAGGGGPNSWQTNEPMLSPVSQEHDLMRPVIRRLLAIPHLRVRYLDHIRTIVNEWLDWDVLHPIIAEYQSLIDAEVKADHKKLYSYEAFAASHIRDWSGGGGPGGGRGGSLGRGGGFGLPRDFGGGRGGRGRRVTPSFKRFVEERSEYLLNHPEINKPTSTIAFVSASEELVTNQPAIETLGGGPVQITAKIGGDVKVDAVILYYAAGRLSPFQSVPMSKNGAVYVGEIPTFPAGRKIHYYVEARSVESHGTTTFFPAQTEFAPLTYRVPLSPIADSSAIVINELMANNMESLTDPQGENDDWIELHNVSSHAVDLSGMYLSDSQKNPRKWKFPDGTQIAPGGYLIVWADEDGKARSGLHANFKLSKNGETVMLIDTDQQGNQVLDQIEFGVQQKDTAIGRLPNGTGDFKPLGLTPGMQNQ